MSGPYHYELLNPAKQDTIRLLKLWADSDNEILVCELEQHSLSDAPAFQALSYVWGPPEPEGLAGIYVDNDSSFENCTLPIRSSLQAALYRLRLEDNDRYLWIDAICINQYDHAEKSLQVPMMGKIYHSARSVIIWLGEEAEDSDLALSFIPRVTNLAQFDYIIKDQSSKREWYALSRLMNRPWFSRRWVVQELAFAKEAKLLCGSGELEWSLFADAATLFGQRQQEIVKLFWMSPEYAHDAEIFGEVQALGALRLINALNGLFRRSDDGQILEGLVSLETLVTSLNGFQTEDPRDSIYAVMQLAETPESVLALDLFEYPGLGVDAYIGGINVDYDSPFFQVAQRFVASCIRGSNSLDIICRPWAPFPNYYYSNFETPILSSWACTMEDAVFEIRGDGHYTRKRGDSFVGTPGRPIYQASRGFPFIPFDSQNSEPGANQFLEIARFSKGSRTNTRERALQMMVKGVVIGKIQSLGERAMEGTIPAGWFAMANWQQRSKPVPEAFYRTLVADRAADGSNPPTWYKRAFEHALVGSGTGDVRLQRMITQSKSSVTTELLQRIQSVIWNRRYAITNQGTAGLVPAKAQVGDFIMVLHGASVPMALRKLEFNLKSYWLVGECYIHGAMDGLKTSEWEEQSFTSSGSSTVVKKSRLVSLR
ncbi:HET-domain-containing protein [Hyaloscypha variabilis F]|uniref:HET-domain-containing protein n=1 Tax=Hyaloscypha variabilis (strain UAMH 11265 / GT02V1 / F) TaxID=1149755 RepID=A0A2J6R0M5_HYAVF|nr:HET-domain-containing protein [Hyaloscypha variabilis F]